jgi:pimeloyl-ACP methyl ester carboxylesterase
LKLIILIVSGVLVLLFLFSSCSNFRKSDKRLQRSLLKKYPKINIGYFEQDSIRGRFLFKDADEKFISLVFVHGSPGSSSSFNSYLIDDTLHNIFNIYVVDRPGYGYSDLGQYHPITSQVNWLSHFIENRLAGQSVFLVGHSFGGPIALHTARQLPELVNGTIMIAPALDPDNEKYFFGGKLAWKKPTRYFFSKAWRVSADEKYNHAEELKQLEPLLAEIHSPVLHIHGTRDKIAPFVNLSYSKKHLNPEILETYEWEKMGHLIPFRRKKEVVEMIVGFVDQHK